jgi:transcriptional regulator with XRE-family HTH domain
MNMRKYRSAVTPLSERVISLIRERKITQKAVADAIEGLDASTLSKLINGDVDYDKPRDPKISTLILLADYFDVSIDYLVGRSDVQTMDEDIRQAVKTTGLSEKVIRALVDVCARVKDPTIDNILGNRERIEKLKEHFLADGLKKMDSMSDIIYRILAPIPMGDGTYRINHGSLIFALMEYREAYAELINTDNELPCIVPESGYRVRAGEEAESLSVATQNKDLAGYRAGQAVELIKRQIEQDIKQDLQTQREDGKS